MSPAGWGAGDRFLSVVCLTGKLACQKGVERTATFRGANRSRRKTGRVLPTPPDVRLHREGAEPKKAYLFLNVQIGRRRESRLGDLARMSREKASSSNTKENFWKTSKLQTKSTRSAPVSGCSAGRSPGTA